MSIRETLLATALYNVGRGQAALEWARRQLDYEVKDDYFGDDASIDILRSVEKALPAASDAILEAMALGDEDSLKNHILGMIAKGYICQPDAGSPSMKSWAKLFQLLEEK